MAQTTLVNQLEVKTSCGTQFDNCGQVKGEDHRIFNLRERPHRASGDCLDLVLITRTFAPVF
ncbi:hypothetical protein D3C73_1320920 [compost metagenome]